MAEIAINGRKLHTVEMKLCKYAKGTSSYLLYPEYRVKTEIEEDKTIVKLPAFLSLELYRSVVIPQNEGKAFPVMLDGKDIGSFRVIDLEYPQDLGDELITISLKRVDDTP